MEPSNIIPPPPLPEPTSSPTIPAKAYAEDSKLSRTFSVPDNSSLVTPDSELKRQIQSIRKEPEIKSSLGNPIDLERQNKRASMEMLADGSRKTLRERTVDLFQAKVKKDRVLKHQSIEVLNAMQIATTNKGSYEHEIQSHLTKSPSSKLFTKMHVDSGTSGQETFLSPVNLSEMTGYKSWAKGINIETGSEIDLTSPPDASSAAYQALSNYRTGVTRSSTVAEKLLRSNSADNLMKTPDPKTFKKWYHSMLKGHDSPQFKVIEKSNFPKVYMLETIFGTKEEEADQYDRLLWMAKCYRKLKAIPAWRVPEKERIPEPLSRELLIPDIVLDGNVVKNIVVDNELDFRRVVSGKIVSLINSLIFPLDQDMSFVEVFLATYRSFLTPAELLRYLRAWYNYDDEKVDAKENPALFSNVKVRFPANRIRRMIQNRTIQVLVSWINNHWYDFRNNIGLFGELTNFVEDLENTSFTSNQKLTHAIREQRLQWYTMQFIPMFTGGRIDVEGNLIQREWDVDSFAQNLTLVEFLLFKKLKPDVYLQIVTEPGVVESGGYNLPLKLLLSYCDWFRTIVAYVTITIAKETTTKKRTIVIRDFIKIARKCLKLKNFNSAFAITYGLRLPPSIIWMSAWEPLPLKYLDDYRSLLELADPANNFENYFATIAACEPPCVPFLVPYMQDLTSMYNNIPLSFDKDGCKFEDLHINFQKFYNMFSVAAELETFRGSLHNLSSLTGDRESSIQLIHHIREVCEDIDDDMLGLNVRFSDGFINDGNPYLNSTMGMKAMKKVVSFLQSVKE